MIEVEKIVEKHRAWDFDKIFYCTREVFDRYKSSNIYMEDFVYFEFKHLKNSGLINVSSE